MAADGEVIMRNDVLRSIWVGEAPVHSIDEFEAYKAYWPETGEPLKPEDWPAAQALQHGESFADVVVDIDRFDGTRGTIVLSTAPIQHDGVLLGAVTIVQDITRVREAEQALRFLTDEVRTLHEAVVLDPAASSAELARIVVTQAGLLARQRRQQHLPPRRGRIAAPHRRRRRARRRGRSTTSSPRRSASSRRRSSRFRRGGPARPPSRPAASLLAVPL